MITEQKQNLAMIPGETLANMDKILFVTLADFGY